MPLTHRLALAVTALLLTTGCAADPQDADLQPTGDPAQDDRRQRHARPRRPRAGLGRRHDHGLLGLRRPGHDPQRGLLMRPPVVSFVAAVALLAGCTSGEDPAPVVTTDGPTSTGSDSATGGQPGDPEPTEEQPATLAFGGGTGGTIPGCRPPRTYLAAYQTVEVAREVRLGEPTVEGQGRIVGQVFLLPPPRRGTSSQGVTSIGDRPSLRLARTSDGWARRVPIEGQLVQPADYAVALQLEVRPGPGIDGVSFSWFDSSATGADQLHLTLRYARRCDR